jgi:hypothetical protein
MPESLFVGLDLGSSHCYQSVINQDGSLRFSRSIPTSEQHLRSAFSNLTGDVRVHLEASELSVWAHSIIKHLVSEVVFRILGLYPGSQWIQTKQIRLMPESLPNS